MKFVLSELTMFLLVSLLSAQFGGGSGTEDDPWQIGTAEHLDNIRNFLDAEHSDKYFIQTADIDLGVPPWNVGEGWEPIGWFSGGDDNSAFTGHYDGNHHVIDGLCIARPDGYTQALFGYTSGSVITNLGVTNVTVSGYSSVAALVAYHRDGSLISNCYSSGSVFGTNDGVGGLVADQLIDSVIYESYSSCLVGGRSYVGGLLGFNSFQSGVGDCYATGNVSASLYHGGGLVGCNSQSIISNSSATGNVVGLNEIGGLAGWNVEGTIYRSYSTGEVSSNTNTGGLVGFNSHGSEITDSYSTGDVSGGWYTGGLIGQNYLSIVSDCHSSGKVEGSSRVGGFIGDNTSSAVSNSYSLGPVISTGSNFGGFIGISTGPAESSYWNIDTSGMTSSAAGEGKTSHEMVQETTFVDWDFNECWTILEGFSTPAFIGQDMESYFFPGPRELIADSGTEVIELEWVSTFTEPLGYNLYRDGVLLNPEEYLTETSYTDANVEIWEFYTYHVTAIIEVEGILIETAESNRITAALFSFAGGDGSEENPYQIETAEQLAGIDSFPNSHYIQITDIDLGQPPWNEGEGWQPIGKNYDQRFTGSYNGNGYTINGLYINRPGTINSSTLGLFGQSEGGIISNVTLIDVVITGQYLIGALVGYGLEMIITNCHSSGTIYGYGSHVGGITGTLDFSEIIDSSSECNVSGVNDIGGLTGDGWLTLISNSNNTGEVSGKNYVGGLIGRLNGLLSRELLDDRTGPESRNQNVTAETIETGSGKNLEARITDSYSDGNIQGQNNVGGLVGELVRGTIKNSYSNGNVTGEESVGGIAGEISYYGLIEHCYSSNKVTGTEQVGGLIGFSYYYSIINQSYFIGTVEGEECIGGLVGELSQTSINNSYNRGEVIGLDRVGGLVGYHRAFSSLNDCYNTAPVYGEINVGGLVGLHSSAGASNSYWDMETSGQSTTSGQGEGRNTVEMTSPYAINTYVDWDFEEIWSADDDYSINDGYPYLLDETVSVEEEPLKPLTGKTLRIYPNPFNPDTNICFELTGGAEIELRIYNIRGQLVRILLNEYLPEGEHTIVWNGRDTNNRSVSSGVYFAELRVTDRKAERSKMLLLK